MNITILFPCDFFDNKKVESDYENEYIEACKLGFDIELYNYDEFVRTNDIFMFPRNFKNKICIYRGWMLNFKQYETLYTYLKNKNVELINTPEQYSNCHLFPNAYPLIKQYTPDILSFEDPSLIDWDMVRSTFNKFMIKDFVKSVKGDDFPVFFDGSYSNEELDSYIKKFISLRGNLFTGGIVIKKYVDLLIIDKTTNEYRAFFFEGNLLSLSKNSNQTTGDSVSLDFVNGIPQFDSRFYTVDFGQLSSGDWIIIEVGDGQVSGLSPNQFVFKFYEELLLKTKNLMIIP